MMNAMRRFFGISSGFTLVEVVVGMALLSSAIIVSTMSYAALSRLGLHGASTRATQQRGRYVLEGIVKDIRSAKTVSISQDPQRLYLQNPFDGATICYWWDSASKAIMRKTITADEGSCQDGQTASEGVQVTGATFARAPGCLVKISLDIKDSGEITDPSQPTYKQYRLATEAGSRGDICSE